MSQQHVTLEHKHNCKIEILEKENLENLYKKKDKLIKKIESCKSFFTKLDIEDELEKLNEKIQDLEKNISTNEYYLDVMNILQKYSELKPKKIENMESFDMFSMKQKSSSQDNKGKLYKEYVQIIDNQILDGDNNEKNTYTCEKCNENFLMSVIESLMICPKCGKAEQYFDINIQGMTYEQEITSEVNVSFSYKRINHFNEWLAQFQAKESTEIPKELLDALTNEFKKSRIKDMNQITTKKVKEFLKKLNYNKYYEHTTHITNLLNGIKPPTMNPILEEKLRNMFRQIQIPFEKHKPKERSNFLSYSYCLYKFCELLGEDSFMNQFPLLKSREKLYQQDCIWKKICYELKWEYIKTI